MVSDLWDNCRIFPRPPIDAFVAKYLYSQPVHAEERFDNAIEDYFSKTVETSWTPIFEKISQKGTIDQSDWFNIVQFTSSMITRVPLSLNATIELLRESVVRNTPDNLPPPPKVLEDAYRKVMGVSDDTNPINLQDMIEAKTVLLQIDPHCAITSMPKLIQSIEIFKPGFSFGVPQFLHNCTDKPFLSSDNPVCYFGGSRKAGHIKPYRIRNKKHFSFVFPLSSKLVMVNSSFLNKRGMHVDISDRGLISEVNRLTAMFSYRYIFGENSKMLTVGKKYNNLCPRPVYERSIVGDGEVFKIDYSFGKPKKLKNSWKYDFKR